MSAERFAALSQYVIKLPVIIFSLVVSLGKTLQKIGKKFIVLPLNTLSGKLFFISLLLLTVTIVGGLLWLLGTWQNIDSWVSLGTTVAIYGSVALVVPGVLFCIAYPLDRIGWIGNVIIATGIRQYSRMSTGIISTLLGLLLAAVFALVTTYVHGIVTDRVPMSELGRNSLSLVDWRVYVVSFVVIFGVSTFLMFYAFQRKAKLHIRTDLTITDVTERDNGKQAVVIRNDSDAPIDLWEAKIEDSNGDYYVLDIHPRLRPGEKATFELPEKFALETIGEVPRGIGPFFGGKKVTAIYARQGDTYVLEWNNLTE